MKVYAQIDPGINRYLKHSGVSIELLLRMGLLGSEDFEGTFWKSNNRVFESIILDLPYADYKILFTRSMEEGKYVGETIEDSLNSAFFRYILL